MKTAFLLLLLLPCVALAQDIALLDRDFKNPIAVTQTVTAAQLSNKLFPVYTTDLDTMVRVLENLARTINTGEVHEPAMQLLPVGHSQFTINTERMGSFNTYAIYLSTRTGDLGASLELVKRGEGNRKTLENLFLFLDYLKNNRHFAEK
jgi:hypothetical protein